MPWSWRNSMILCNAEWYVCRWFPNIMDKRIRSKNIRSLSTDTVCVETKVNELSYLPLPCILHWNQNHFVVLYKVKKGKKFYVADPGKGLVKYNLEEFKIHWISTRSNGEEKGIAMFLEPTPVFYSHKEDDEGEKNKNPRSFRFLFDYVKKYIRYFGQIVLGLIVGSLPSAIPSR